MAGKFCVTLTNCRNDPDKATVAFVIANAALGSDQETLMFCSADGVWAAVKGEAEKINEGPPFAPMAELLSKFLAGGGKLIACTPCLKKRGIDPDQLVEGAITAGGAALVEWLSDGSPSISY